MSTLVKYSRRMRKRPTWAEKNFKRILLPICGINKLRMEDQKVFWNPVACRGYIVDFYVARIKVVFEIDGESHKKPDQIKDDQVRDRWFADKGMRVIRVSNQQTKDEGYCTGLILGLIKEQYRKPLSRKRKAVKPKILNSWDENGVKVVEYAPVKTPVRYRRRSKLKKKKGCRLETPGTFAGSVLWK